MNQLKQNDISRVQAYHLQYRHSLKSITQFGLTDITNLLHMKTVNYVTKFYTITSKAIMLSSNMFEKLWDVFIKEK